MTIFGHSYLVLLSLFAYASIVLADDANFLTVTLQTDSAARYIVPADMGPVAATQSFNLALSMGTSYISVVGTNCTTCSGSPAYNQSKSTTAQSLSGSANFTLIGGGSTSGGLVTEDCRLPTNNGSLWGYPNQTMVVATNSTGLFNSQVSGILGLQTGPAQSAQFNSSVIGSVFGRNPTKSSFTYGMALQPPSVANTNAGELHWLGPDTSAFSEPVIMLNTSSVSSSLSSSGGVGIPITVFALDGWTVSIVGSNGIQATNTALQAALDPYYPAIYFPANQAKLIHDGITGSSPESGDNGQSTVWTVPCATQFSLSSTIGGASFSLDQSQLIQKNSDGTCLSYIRGWADSTIETYLFGSSFISSLYLIVQVANPSSGLPNQIGLATRVIKSSSTPVGAIVGGVIGGIVVLALTVVGIFFIIRRNKKKDTYGVGTYSPEPKVEPYIYPPESEPIGSYTPNTAGFGSPTVQAPLLPAYDHGDTSRR